jgi:DNA repair protein SbcC/Rad50
MIIKKLSIKNIRSYKELSLEFPVGTILLSGDIGAGKTSILLALQFALFGLQPGQKGASLLRQGEESASAKLTLDIDGEEIEIERSLKKSKNGSIAQEDSILKIGKETFELSTSELKNKVISLLDYPKEFAKKSDLLYKYTVYTPQEGMKEIVNERPETRLDLIRHIFGVDRYKRIKDNSQLFLQRIKENIKIKEVQIKEINNLREKLVLASEEKIKVAKELLDYSTALEKVSVEKKELKDKIDILKQRLEEKAKSDVEKSKKEGELQGKKALKMRLERDISASNYQLTEKIEFKQESLDNITLLLLKHKRTLEDLSQRFTEASAKVYSLDSQKEVSLNLKEKIISMENCPTCIQSVTHEHKDKISKKTQFEIEDIQRELEQKLILRSQLIKDIENEKEFIQKYEQDKMTLEREKIKFEHQRIIDTKIKSDSIILDRTRQEISTLESEIMSLSSQIVKFEDAKQLFEQEKTKFDVIDLESRKLDIRSAEKRKEVEMLKKQVEQIGIEIAQKENIREQMAKLRGLQDWLEEKFLPLITLTETNVMITLRRDFSKIFNEWFSTLVSDSLSVRLNEDFTPIISSQDYEIDYDFLSGGERTAVALAYRLALNQVINSMLSKLKTKDIIILDEPTDGFSEQQLDKMRDIFEQLDAKQIILVSHEQKIEGFVDSIIRIKKDGTSKIESVK